MRGESLTHRRGVSLKLKTTAVVAVALAAALAFLVYVVGVGSVWQAAIVCLALFAVTVLTFDLWVYRPVEGLIRRSRRRLGGDYEQSDPHYRDEVRSSDASSRRSSPCSRRPRTRSGSRRPSWTTSCAPSRSTGS